MKQVMCGHQLPVGLLDLDEPPPQLVVRGELPAGPVVALVGTRNPSPEAVEFTEQFASDLASAGVVIASGGAKGIDTAAHRGAIRFGGCSVVVAPCGYDRPFPTENGPLFSEIVKQGGAFLSEYADDTPAHSSYFFRRNSYLAALSVALVVTEAPFKSGARNAAKWARRLGRPVFAVPSAPWNPRGAGCNLELKQGAEVATSAKDVLKYLHEINAWAVAPSQSSRSRHFPDDATEVDLQLPLID